jgi:hypothetical protein
MDGRRHGSSAAGETVEVLTRRQGVASTAASRATAWALLTSVPCPETAVHPCGGRRNTAANPGPTPATAPDQSSAVAFAISYSFVIRAVEDASSRPGGTGGSTPAWPAIQAQVPMARPGNAYTTDP